LGYGGVLKFKFELGVPRLHKPHPLPAGRAIRYNLFAPRSRPMLQKGFSLLSLTQAVYL
jgi:hypothetical protein